MKTVVSILLSMIFFVSFSQDKVQDKAKIDYLIKLKTEDLIKKYQFFDDFIQKFSSDSDFQLKRVIFPLIYKQINNVDTINRNNWIYKKIYYCQVYEATAIKIYCDSLFSSKDSVYANDYRDIVYIDKKHNLKKYGFVKNNRFWFLSDIEQRELTKQDDFIDYLLNLSNDSISQINCIDFPIFHRYIDKESEDFPYIDEFITKDKWNYNPNLFKFIDTEIPLELYKCNSDYRLFIYYGLNNGIHDEYLFKKINGKWKLIGIYDLSM
jgi:hypothetical protein